VSARFAKEEELRDHAKRHGPALGCYTSAAYEKQASDFLTGPKGPAVLEKNQADGSIVRYDPATDEFGILGPDGSIVTYFKPDPAIHGFKTNLEYFNAQ